MSNIHERQKELEQKYSIIKVKYGDGSTKDFTPTDFALFEYGIRRMNGIEISMIEK